MFYKHFVYNYWVWSLSVAILCKGIPLATAPKLLCSNIGNMGMFYVAVRRDLILKDV